MKVYVAGPMRGRPDFNFPAFFFAAAELRKLGHEPFNPAERDIGVHGDVFHREDGDETQVEGFSLREALRADTSFITSEAEAICVLPGWGESRGACAEVSLARALGIPTAYLAGFTEDGIKTPLLYESLELLPMNYVTPFINDLEAVYSASEASPGGETRSVSSSGGEKGTKAERFDLVPARPLRLLAELYGAGSRKYEDRNWERGYEWSKSFAALQRHLWQFWAGENTDGETGVPHVINAAWHCFALAEYLTTHPEFDDRAQAVQVLKEAQSR